MTSQKKPVLRAALVFYLCSAKPKFLVALLYDFHEDKLASSSHEYRKDFAIFIEKPRPSVQVLFTCIKVLTKFKLFISLHSGLVLRNAVDKKKPKFRMTCSVEYEIKFTVNRIATAWKVFF